MDHDAVAKRATSPFKSHPRLLLALVVAAVVIVADQIVKALVDRLIGPESGRADYWIAGDWLGLDYVRNRGVAFGVQFGSSTLTVALSLTVFVLIGWSFWRMAGESRLAVIGIGLLAGGGVGNMIDRLRHGAVIDFVAVGPWPRFNVADSAITIGVLLLAWSVLTAQEQTPDDPTKEHSPHAATGSERFPH